MKVLAYSVALIGVLITSQWQIVLSKKYLDEAAIIELMKSNVLRISIDESQTTPGEIVEGNRVTFSCKVDPPNGLTVFRNFFYRNNTPIYSNPELGIYNFGRYLTYEKINKTEAGLYFCMAFAHETSDWSMQSSHYDLRVLDKPEVSPGVKEIANASLQLISRSFIPENIEQFSDVSLQCDVHPSTIIGRKYSWFRNGVKIIPNNTIGAQLNNSALILRRIEQTAIGTYLCKVETDKGVLWSNFLAITVLEKIASKEVREWLTELDNAEKLNGSSDSLKAYSRLGDGINPDEIRELDTVYFVCESNVNVTEIKQINWFENRRIIQPNPEIGIIQRDPYLILERVPKQMAGVYKCEIQTQNNHVYSTHTLLNIKDNANSSTKAIDWNTVKLEALMQLTPGLDPDSIVEQDNVNFTCTILPPNVTRIRRTSWYHNSKILHRSERVGLLNQNSTLLLPRIEKYYAGSYQCVMDTNLGIFRSNYIVITVHNISVKVPPTLTASIRNGSSAHVEEFENVYIQCDIKPDLSNVRMVRWLRDDKVLSSEDGVDILTWTSILIIPNIRPKASGKYRCQAKTKADAEIRSNTVEIFVSPKNSSKFRDPLVITELVDHPETIRVNTPTFFYCHIHTNETLYDILWYYNLGPLRPGVASAWYEYSGRTLIISRTKEEFVGEFECAAVTKSGHHVGIPTQLKKVLSPGKLEVISPNRTVGTKLIAEVQADPDKIYELDKVVFYCDVQPSLTFFQTLWWYFNNTRVDERKPFTYYSGDFMRYGERIYSISRANGSVHNGNYSCEILTYEGTVFKSEPTQLNIKKRLPDVFYPSPVIVNVFAQPGFPKEIDQIHEHDNVFFICEVQPNNTNVLDILWYFNEQPLWGILPEGVEYVDRDLYMYNIAKERSGRYLCEISTKTGLCPSQTEIVLKVKPPLPNEYY